MSAFRSVQASYSSLRMWPARRWLIAAVAAAATAVAVGIPTAVIPTPLFSRAVPTQWWNHPTLVLTSVLAGLLIASYTSGRPRPLAESQQSSDGRRLGPVGGLLAFLAVGCPVCNKLVLLLVGTSGALSLWAPLQPAIAVASVALLAVATVRRLATEAACPVPTPPGHTPEPAGSATPTAP